MNLCIPPKQAEKLAKAIEKTGIVELLDKTAQERQEFLRKYLDRDLANLFLEQFNILAAESKRTAIIKTLKTLGLKKEEATKLAREIRKIPQEVLLDPNFDFSDQITRVFVELSEKEVSTISKYGEAIEKYQTELELTKPIKNGQLNPKFKEVMYNLAVNQKKLDSFLHQVSPKSAQETFWSHAKASMLLKPASYVVNILSNAINSVFGLTSRRIAFRKVGGYNSDLAREYKKLFANIYAKTGYDYTRALSLDEMITGKGKLFGEVASRGKETFLTKLVFEKALGGPDAFSARLSFADTANIASSKIADQLGLKGKKAKDKAAEIMADAFLVIPKTEHGKYVREIAVAQALKDTFTNDSWATKFTFALKNAFNFLPGAKTIRYGDIIEPFVKTPANVISQGLDASGAGFLKSTVKFIRYFKAKKLDTSKAQTFLTDALQDASKAGVGLIASFLLAEAIGEDNFIGAYDPRRVKYEQLRNSNFNAVKIGDRWISLDYFGVLATPLVAILAAKQARKDKQNSALTFANYLKGVAYQGLKLPFMTSFYEMIEEYKTASSVDKKKFLPVVSKIFNEQIASRIPGILGDIARLTDDAIRDTSKGIFSFKGITLDPIVAKIPFVARHLPEKKNMLAETLKPETKINSFIVGAFTILLAGARIKTEVSSPAGKEIYRLMKTGNTPQITNWRYIQSQNLQKVKDKLGEEKFNQLFDRYGEALKTAIETLMKTPEYKRANDEEKAKMISKQEDVIMDKIFKKYLGPNYRKR